MTGELSRARELLALAVAMAEHERDVDADRWQAAVEERADELDGAVTAFLDAGAEDAALRLVGTLSYLCQDTGRVTLGRDLATRVLTTVGEVGDARDRARVHLTLGELAFRQGDQPVAIDASEAALRLVSGAGDQDVERRAEMNLARVALRDGDADAIRRHAERMLDLAGKDPAARLGAVHMLGWAEHTAGQIEAAMQHFEDNVLTARAVGNRPTEGSELLNLASLSLELGDTERASSYLRRGIDVAADLGSSYLLPAALTEAGRLLVLCGRPEEGLTLIVAGERQYELAGLTPDPGDDAFLEQRAGAVASLPGDRVEELVTVGAAMSRDEAVALARTELGS
ncbi:tetratricopeptide repeat protein [Nitriliruptor alkaliphilus]|uniref:tetratricopeptide repeat protein n=1 Tax=Nitriliruptor alkaliphilus TaxID=427918 RepID=UPI0006966428|nr:hypothetical protein [Nitriliruptor alkaliphilus]